MHKLKSSDIRRSVKIIFKLFVRKFSVLLPARVYLEAGSITD
jgi:hypothetical protein